MHRGTAADPHVLDESSNGCDGGQLSLSCNKDTNQGLKADHPKPTVTDCILHTHTLSVTHTLLSHKHTLTALLKKGVYY